jgi:hypothetical protein
MWLRAGQLRRRRPQKLELGALQLDRAQPAGSAVVVHPDAAAGGEGRFHSTGTALAARPLINMTGLRFSRLFSTRLCRAASPRAHMVADEMT